MHLLNSLRPIHPEPLPVPGINRVPHPIFQINHPVIAILVIRNPSSVINLIDEQISALRRERKLLHIIVHIKSFLNLALPISDKNGILFPVIPCGKPAGVRNVTDTRIQPGKRRFLLLRDILTLFYGTQAERISYVNLFVPTLPKPELRYLFHLPVLL